MQKQKRPKQTLRIKREIFKIKNNKIRRKIYELEKNENVSNKERKNNEKYLTELEKGLHKFKKYHEYDDLDYKGIRDIENLFDEITEDYNKPIKNGNNAFM